MKLHHVLLGVSLALSAAASAASVTMIPADLEARAAELRKHASPQVLAWARDQGAALARARGPVDLALLERNVRSQFAWKRAPAATQAVSPGGVTYRNLGQMGDADIMAIAFIVMMEAAKSAQEDLKAIMDGVKAINKEKEGWRKVSNEVDKTASSKWPTPTPPPDRAAELVAAARSVSSKTHGANLATTTRR